MRFRFALRWLPVVAVLAATLAARGVWADVTSAPPAAYINSFASKAIPAAFLLSSNAQHRSIVLGTPSATERAALVTANTATANTGVASASNAATTSSSLQANGKLSAASLAAGKGRPLAIGFGRTVPVAQRTISGTDLTWISVADGGRAARIDLSSEGAAAIRVALAMTATDPDITVRFAGSAPGAQVFGPYPANAIAESTARDGKYWSPVLDGSTASIEIYLPPGIAPSSVGLTLVSVSHLVAAGTGLLKIDPKALGIGDSDVCEIDVACVTPQTVALTTAKNAVAKILFTQDNGQSYLCTGTLINDAASSNIPYFYTANHCINSQVAAGTIKFYFFFAALNCGSTSVPPYVLLTNGAFLLGRSDDWDWSLVRLFASPPTGTTLSAWNATPLTQSGVSAIVLHHPEADLLKWSSGATQGVQSYSDGSSFTSMVYSQGSTEPGSSGSGLLTLNTGSGFYELRGGLYGGDASCSDRGAFDVYSRLDNALPLLRQYLTPGTPNPGGAVPVVEYYNGGLQHYFMTTDPAEINDLDTGVHPGWVRTGLRFLAYTDPATAPSTANPVCRFYLPPTYPNGDSHFYSADPDECQRTMTEHPDWIFESPSVFYIQLPDQVSGACAGGTRAVYRFLNNSMPNHRYTAEIAERNAMANDTFDWMPEGYGPGPYYPTMCSPLQ